MAIKNISLGQYFPGVSPIHKLDPRAKIIILVLYIVGLFVSASFIGYALQAVLLFLVVSIAHIKPKALFNGLKPIFIIILITGIINILFTKGAGVPLISFWRISIYSAGIRAALFMMFRICLLIIATFTLTYTTSPIRLTDGMENLLGPLKRIHLPIHEVSMMMSIALRFIPTLIEETDKIMSAQKARGADFETGNFVQKAKALLPLLVPLFVSAFRRADELATAMECRCYHGGEGRTRMIQLKYGRNDFISILIAVIMLAAIIILRKIGF